MPVPTDTTRRYRILFVCLGNICRSPAAEGIMLHLLQERGLSRCVEVDSAGTYAGHAGELPDARMRAHAARRGYLLEHRSRPVTDDDFDRFDLIIGMDDNNIDRLRRMAPDVEAMAKIHRMTDYARHYVHDHVPDPYYSGAEGFELVLTILEDACEGLLDTLYPRK
ncbi:MAG: low molecular weight phosphotyrosine protein phosphatase [Coprobacter sp.]|nr:low molecular weight phosphotyrosine protein phosphatase [Coprobacter sp.]